MTNSNLAIFNNNATTPNTNLPTANINTAMTTDDQINFMSSLDSDQQMQFFLEQQRFQTALTVEHWRLENSLMLADKEQQNKLAQIQYQANRDDQREAMKSHNAIALANKERENQLERMQVEQQNRLEQMQVELQNHKAIAEFNTELSIISKLMEEDGKGRTSILARMECSHKDQDKTLYMLRESFVQDRLAKKQHNRNLEKMQLESLLKRREQYVQSYCLRNSQEEKAKQKLDQLFAMWEKEDKGI